MGGKWCRKLRSDPLSQKHKLKANRLLCRIAVPNLGYCEYARISKMDCNQEGNRNKSGRKWCEGCGPTPGSHKNKFEQNLSPYLNRVPNLHGFESRADCTFFISPVNLQYRNLDHSHQLSLNKNLQLKKNRHTETIRMNPKFMQTNIIQIIKSFIYQIKWSN